MGKKPFNFLGIALILIYLLVWGCFLYFMFRIDPTINHKYFYSSILISFIVMSTIIPVTWNRTSLRNVPEKNLNAKLVSRSYAKETVFSDSGSYDKYSYFLKFELEDGNLLAFEVNKRTYSSMPDKGTGVLVIKKRGKKYSLLDLCSLLSEVGFLTGC